MPNLNISFAPDKKAVSHFDSKRTTASAMSSADWERIAPAIREKCFFSARVNNAEVLGKMRDLLGSAIDSTRRNPEQAIVSSEKFISEMKSFLKSRGYTTGGTKLTDITSRRRLSLIYEMNVAEAREYGRYVRGQDADTLAMYPAQEFLRVEQRKVPRTDWEIRWRAAGGKIVRGRMVALKSDAVWTNLSRFGRPYPPFDYGSGMGVEDIDHNEAIELGLLPADEPCDEIPDFDVAVEAEVSLERIPEDLREQFIKETPNAELKGDKLIMRSSPKLPTWQDLELDDVRKWERPTYQYNKPKTDAEIEKKAKENADLIETGETQTTPIGNIRFEKEVYNDWAKYGKKIINDRLSYLDLAKHMAATTREVWYQHGQYTLINTFLNKDKDVRGFVVVVLPNGNVVKTYFIRNESAINSARKGKLIWSRK